MSLVMQRLHSTVSDPTVIVVGSHEMSADLKTSDRPLSDDAILTILAVAMVLHTVRCTTRC